ncbi:MAG TPA: Spy/CpxP family protein refolding chaperone [Candidatus Binatia bacterium]|jgi:Spy/CpxP family protein refolding chaperone
MNKVRKLILGSAFTVLTGGALVSAPIVAGQENTEPAKRPFARGDRMIGAFAAGAPLISIALNHKTELNLTSEQVANLEKIKEHYQSQVTPLYQQVQSIEKEIATLMQQTPANLIQIKSKIQEAEKYRSELRYLRVEALDNGRSVLSTEQQDQLKTLVRSRFDRFRGRHGQPS